MPAAAEDEPVPFRLGVKVVAPIAIGAELAAVRIGKDGGIVLRLQGGAIAGGALVADGFRLGGDPRGRLREAASRYYRIELGAIVFGQQVLGEVELPERVQLQLGLVAEDEDVLPSPRGQTGNAPTKSPWILLPSPRG